MTTTMLRFYGLAVYLCVFVLVTTENEGDFLYKEMCYFDSGVPYVGCSNISSVMSVRDLILSTNCSACSCNNVNGSCSQFSPESYKENYYFYYHMSGKTSNTFKAERARCPTKESVFSNTVKIAYSCVEGNSIMNFCSKDERKFGQIVFLQYKSLNSNPSSQHCQCFANVSNGFIQIEAVDIRLQSTNQTDCPKSNSSYLEFDRSKNISCQNNVLLGRYENIYNSTTERSTSNISLFLRSPFEMVWIAVKSSNGNDVEVICNKREPLITTESYAPISTSSATVSAKSPHVQPTTTNTVQSPHAKPTATVTVQFNPTGKATTQSPRVQSTVVTTTMSQHSINNTETLSLVTSATSDEIDKSNDLEIKKLDKQPIVDPAIITLVMAAVLVFFIILIGIINVRARWKTERLTASMNVISGKRPRKRLERNDSHNYEMTESIGDVNVKPDQRTPKDQLSSRDFNYAQINKPFKNKDNYQKRKTEMDDSLSFDLRDDYHHLTFENSTDNSEFLTERNEYDHASPGLLFEDMHHNVKNQDLNESQNTISSSNHADMSFDQLSSDFINPYVDDAVTEGMKNQRDFMKSQTSIDKAMRDMVNHAQDWASTYSGDKNKLDRYDQY